MKTAATLVSVALLAVGCARAQSTDDAAALDAYKTLPTQSAKAASSGSPAEVEPPSATAVPAPRSPVCVAASALLGDSGDITDTSRAYRTPTGALVAQLGDLLEPAYNIKVTDEGPAFVRWEITVEDSRGATHLAIVDAASADGERWGIQQAQWCLTDAETSAASKQAGQLQRQQLTLPDDFSDCPMHSATPEILYTEDAEGAHTPGEVLREYFEFQPTTSFTITTAEAAERTVRWDIRMPQAPWGLTYGKMIVNRNYTWWLRTFEWCHMEPDRVRSWAANR